MGSIAAIIDGYTTSDATVTVYSQGTPASPDNIEYVGPTVSETRSARVLEYYRYQAYGEPTVLPVLTGGASGDFDEKPYTLRDNANNLTTLRTTHGPEIGRWSTWHTNNLGFQGKPHDPNTGLQYSRHRLSNPLTGRWLSSDPLGYGDSFNLRQSTLNRPTRLADPHGLITLFLTGPQPWWQEEANEAANQLVPASWRRYRNNLQTRIRYMTQGLKSRNHTTAATVAYMAHFSDAAFDALMAQILGFFGSDPGIKNALRHCVLACILTKRLSRTASYRRAAEMAKSMLDDYEVATLRQMRARGEVSLHEGRSGSAIDDYDLTSTARGREHLADTEADLHNNDIGIGCGTLEAHPNELFIPAPFSPLTIDDDCFCCCYKALASGRMMQSLGLRVHYEAPADYPLSWRARPIRASQVPEDLRARACSCDRGW